MKFKTESGSEYEVNADDKKIRRLFGKVKPTDRQGADGEWKKYEDISDIVVGRSVIVVYGKAEPLLPGSPRHAVPGCVTSRVASVQQ